MLTNHQLHDLESRLEQNQPLATGGLPHQLAPLAYIWGTHTWQTLALTSFLLTSLWFLTNPLNLLKFIRFILFMG